MLQDRLTPLGRQLRTALANVCPSSRKRSTLYPKTSASDPSLSTQSFLNGVRHLHTSYAPQAAAPAVFERTEKWKPSAGHYDENQGRTRKHSWRRLNRRTHVAHVTLALCSTDKQHLVYSPPTLKPGFTHVSVPSRHRWQKYGRNRMHNTRDMIPDPATSQEPSLPRLLASYLRHITVAKETASGVTHGLTEWEIEYLRREGFKVQDISAWAQIVAVEGSLEAARLISQRINSYGPFAVPIFVYMQVLRRPHITSQALRIILQHFTALFDIKFTSSVNPGRYMPSLFQATIRLIRHARMVWTQALPSIADLFIRHLESTHQSRQCVRPHDNMRSLAMATHWLNKIMSLISASSAILPFRDNGIQEAAVVRILSFMANHDPPLYPNRDGYRAVIRLQLAQPKSQSDRLWAELKALSWPPWKTSRTAVDDAIGPEQGISSAQRTLRQMHDAGYASLDWERSVQAYAGWDADGTPTIQTRALVPRDVPSYSRLSAKWVARIETTRTVQEAWACYLAWEDSRLPSDENIYLAIFKRLVQEEKRRRNQSPHLPDGNVPHIPPLLPGDSREIAQLPPSTHLHTYTRTPPPSVDDFYQHLKERGICLRNQHLLALVIANASSLQVGIGRLEDGLVHYPDIQGLLSFNTPHDLSAIPIEVFTAAIELFYRFAKVPPRWVSGHANEKPSELLLNNQRLDRNHLAVRALEILKLRRTYFRPAWNAALEGLTRDPNLSGLRTAILAESIPRRFDRSGNVGSNTIDLLEKSAGSMVAYRLVQLTLALYRELHMELDMVGFRYLCLATENLAIATWTILQMDHGALTAISRSYKDIFTRYVGEANQMLCCDSYEEQLRSEFQVIFGEDSGQVTSAPLDTLEAVTPEFPRLLAIPNPALLHVYVRALGWMADYDGLSSLVRWMKKYREELAERRRHDRNGEAMMRRTLVAIRVFLERSWLRTPDDGQHSLTTATDDSVESWAGNVLGTNILERLRNPAAPEVIRTIKDIIDSVEDWGGWPSQQKVEAYCQHRRFTCTK